jgi:hypothetical protein
MDEAPQHRSRSHRSLLVTANEKEPTRSIAPPSIRLRLGFQLDGTRKGTTAWTQVGYRPPCSARQGPLAHILKGCSP